jgi:hypothetical protein
VPFVLEPILESAPLAREAAQRLCRPDPETGESCFPVHGIWLYLRALGLIAGPEHHAGFLRDAFGIVAGTSNRPRVLVSGAADYSMAAHVEWACREHGASPATTVVDLCETPLYLNRWYAQRTGFGVETRRSDILRYDEFQAFHAVCTHSFLGRFCEGERSTLLARWKRLLKPGGVAITVNRVRAGSSAGRIGFSEEQTRAFCAAVTARAGRIRPQLDIDPQDLGRWAEAYAAQRWLYPVRSLEEMRRLFEDGGFEVERLSEARLEKSPEGNLSGPATLEGASYACVIARRPR